MGHILQEKSVNERESIGGRIRQRRQEMGFTLRELAEKTDVTASFISQVERDQINASVNSLRRIAEALGVSMLHFVQEKPRPDPILHSGTRSVLTFSDTDLNYELLTPRASRAMEVFIGRIGPGTSYASRPLPEPTEECIYLLSGEVVIGLDSGDHVLKPDDSIYFEGANLRHLTNPTEQEAVWIAVISPPAY
jgi:transcriptional regulator with XRE-family HTH domain